MVGHILHYHPAIQKLHELVNSGILGQIRYIYSNRLNIGKIRTEENILWSFAPHDISVILSLLDEIPSRVSSQGGAFLNRERVRCHRKPVRFPQRSSSAYLCQLAPPGEGAAACCRRFRKNGDLR